MGAKALNPESRLLGDLERQRQRMGLESSAVHKVLPEAPVLMVGAQLSSAFRPFARDLASKLGPPNATDEALERIAETMLLAQPELMTERIEVESKVGVQASPEGYLLLEGPLLPKDPVQPPPESAGCGSEPRIIALPAPPRKRDSKHEGLATGANPSPQRLADSRPWLTMSGYRATLRLHGDGDVIVIDRDQEEYDATLVNSWRTSSTTAHPKCCLPTGETLYSKAFSTG